MLQYLGENRKKIFDILITALISALIAFLQNLLIGAGTNLTDHTNPAVASAIGAGIRGFTVYKNV